MVLKPTGISAGETSTTTNTVASTEEIEGGNDDSFRDNEAVENSDKGAASGSGSAPKKMNWAPMVATSDTAGTGKANVANSAITTDADANEKIRAKNPWKLVMLLVPLNLRRRRRSDEKSASSTKSKSEATAKQSPAPKESK